MLIPDGLKSSLLGLPAFFFFGKPFIHCGKIQLFVIFQKTGLFLEKFRIAIPDQFGPGRDPQRFPFPFGEDCLLPGIRFWIPSETDR